MCGICGWVERDYGQNEARAYWLARMNEALKHRGPDEAGQHLFPTAALAMSRLSIIDIGSGQQPIANEDKTVWIVFNGEIYNYRDLTGGLLEKGHQFHTHSDTETIVHLYEDSQENCVEQLRGMFAFAIWDTKRQRLTLARDRVGKKPLYYYHSADTFVFGSEIKALLQHPAVSAQPNEALLPLYLQFGYLPEPYTFFSGIKKLPSGCTLTLDQATWEMTINRYWDFPLPIADASDFIEDENEAARMVYEGIQEAVAVRLEAEVPLGIFLSGGLDSTAVLETAVQQKSPLRTFTAGFADAKTYDERSTARAIAQHFGTLHTEFVVKPDIQSLLPTLIWHYDEPFFDSSAVPTYLTARLARKHVTVVLNGDGGDELFGGYERFLTNKYAQWYGTIPRIGQSFLKHALTFLPDGTSYGSRFARLRRLTNYAELPLSQQYLNWASLYDQQMLDRLVAAPNGYQHYGQKLFGELFSQTDMQSPLQQMMYVHARTALIDDLLVKADRMSMANSVEGRSPLLDQELFKLAARLPDTYKLRGRTTKWILRKALAGRVPEQVLKLPKHGFSIPIGRWFQTDLSTYIQQTLLSKNAQLRYLIDTPHLHQLVNEHVAGKRNWANQLWGLLTLESWLTMLKDGSLSSPTPPPKPTVHSQEQTIQFPHR